jgi:hypothetical protein
MREKKMLTSAVNASLPQSLLTKDRPSASNQRQTRANAKVTDVIHKSVDTELQETLQGSSGRKKIGSKEHVRMEGRKKGKPLSTALVDVVFGRPNNSMADEEELRRKRKEDTIRCGRLVKTVRSSSNDNPSPQKITDNFTTSSKYVRHCNISG